MKFSTLCLLLAVLAFRQLNTAVAGDTLNTTTLPVIPEVSIERDKLKVCLRNDLPVTLQVPMIGETVPKIKLEINHRDRTRVLMESIFWTNTYEGSTVVSDRPLPSGSDVTWNIRMTDRFIYTGKSKEMADFLEKLMGEATVSVRVLIEVKSPGDTKTWRSSRWIDCRGEDVRKWIIEKKRTSKK